MAQSEGKVLAKAEGQGRGGDALLGHLTPGDVVIPRGRVTPEVLELLQGFMPDLDVFTAGHERNSLNPYTGLAEFADGVGGDGGANEGGVGMGGGQDGGFDGGGYGNPNNPGEVAPGNFGGGGFLGGGFSPEAAAFDNPNDLSGLGFGPDMGAGPGGGGGLGGFVQAIGTAISNAGGVFGNGAEPGGAGGGVDGNPPAVQLPAQAPGIAAPVAPGNLAPLTAPVAPNVVDTVPQLGQYFQALRSGDQSLAQNLLAPYLNRNLYGS